MAYKERILMKTFSLVAVLYSLSAFALIPSCCIAAEQPLLQEGKKTVWQRVVSHPGAKLYASPQADGSVVSTPRTFTSFYVYERNGDMVRVGVASNKSDGWLKQSDTTVWPQAITMVFTDPMGRQPVLFFRDHDEIQKVCEAESVREHVAQYVELFSKKARIPDGCPVVAMEPMGEDGRVAEKDFYLLPVMNIDAQFKESGTQLLQVACIDPGIQGGKDGGKAGQEGQNGNGGASAPQRMKTALAFVIDTTISMKPYIDQTLAVVRRIYDELQKSPARDDLAIAVVAFRSNLEKSPGIEYTTKVISDFKNVNQRSELERLLGEVREATASTHAFDEDSYAGVKDAVDKLTWAGYSAKTMLLISDAGPLGAGDPTSKTGLSAEALADYLRTNGIYLTAVHVKTPSGKKDHRYAETAYRALSMMSNGKSSYIPIDAKTPAQGAKQFDSVATSMATVYRKIVEQTAQGTQVEKPKVEESSKEESPEELAKRLAEATGYAMRLQFAGDRKGTTAPQVVSAWIADSDLSLLEANPKDAPVPAVYPAVLLTKSQLSKLRDQVKLIIETAENAFLQDSADFNFYEQLISAAAQMSRDPSQFNQDPNANLAQKGVLLEVLDGLPYKSRILGMQKEDWVNMSTGEQREFIKRLKGLVRRYEEYDSDVAHWEGFGSQNSADWVYRVPLTMLP